MRKIDLTETGKTHVSPSQLKAAAKSVDDYDHYLNGDREYSDSLDLGTLVHCLILEPEEFDKRYIVFDGSKKIKEIIAASIVDLTKKGKLTDAEIQAKVSSSKPTSTKVYKDFKAQFEANAGTKKVIDKKMHQTAKLIYNKMKMEGHIDTFFSGGEAEVKTYGTLKLESGREVDAMCIIDYKYPDRNIDLKTTSEKNFDSLRFAAIKYGYDIQAKVTEELTGNPFVFVYVQTVEPYKIAVVDTTQLFMQAAEGKIEKAIDNIERYCDGEVSSLIELNF